MRMEDVLEIQMMNEASRMIDKMIPPGGTSGMGFLAQMDLTAQGSSAFGQVDLSQRGSDAFGGMGGWLGRSFNRVKGLLFGKAKKAKKELKQVATAVKSSEAEAASSLAKSKRATNASQKQNWTKKAKQALDKAEGLRKAAEKVAVEAVDPKVTRAEVKEAIAPAIKQIAKDVAESGKETIQAAAKVQAAAPVESAILAAGKPELVKEEAKQALRARFLKKPAGAVVKPITPATAPPGLWSQFLKWFKARPATPGQPALTTFQSPVPSSAITSALKQSGVVSGYLRPEDLRPEADIVESWETDDMFGEALVP